jgi:glycosyltransferase involved in cell wall biosynthesis
MVVSGLELPSMSRVLFIVENDYFPLDARVNNECLTLSDIYACYVLAPRQAGQRFCENLKAGRCYRYPHFEANSLKYIMLEYVIAAFWIGLLAPVVTLIHRIRVIHVANPPDFVIPLLSWLKLFGIKIVFDVHDLSVETFKGKAASRSVIGRHIAAALDVLDSLSIRIADLVVVTNGSIKERVQMKTRAVPVEVVRNSNPTRFRSLEQVGKRQRNGVLNIGYFGFMADDEAAGLSNVFSVAEVLARGPMPYQFSMVGDGPGLSRLKRAVQDRQLDRYFRFFGYVRLPDAFDLVKDFDFGLVTLADFSKNHLHTAMKIMDYMCCAVPVCSLRLKEQMNSTQNIGIHEETFEQIGTRMLDVFQKQAEYEALRQRTLTHFNKALSWELQRQNLLSAYRGLLNIDRPKPLALGR